MIKVLLGQGTSLPYIYLTVLGLALFIIFPGIATWLPRHM